MDSNLKNYLEYTKKPWGKLFYKVVFQQLNKVKGFKVLDFGSGFGITAEHLAKNNEVVAIEPNSEMVRKTFCKSRYNQIIGGLQELRKFKDASFDVVLCHNVFEYAKDREEIFREFLRVIKKDGIISIIKHNHAGRIMQKVVFENNIEEAIKLLDGGNINSINLGQVAYYNLEDIKKWGEGFDFNVEKILGIRTFWGLQNNEIKEEPSWQDKMFQIEMKVSDIKEYVDISFFNHVILRK
ncbi:class I SAM-dependent methyltransferase [Clostridium felsineum]|uniref:class I SAM-dependent methyltransferase n=1 Tax=Clostridium felsineum TaxID=36839 RepID=UPI00098CA539|nr:class I SAM-dependent methyltransferase [Clostridium felsineum]MCR3760339.1 class I SAM-dependent methyltransferase [Clostridium felsineum]URZ17211.1 tRNA 5-carboxymethoxyuridine methyltransferase [Clostridium felsineum DSM 794]